MRLSGCPVTPEEARAMYRRIIENTADTGIVVLSGSLPPSQGDFHNDFFMKLFASPDISAEFREFYERTVNTGNGSDEPFNYFYALLIAQLQKDKKRVFLDAKGDPFRLGLAMKPFLVKQDIEEFR